MQTVCFKCLTGRIPTQISNSKVMESFNLDKAKARMKL